MPVFYSTRSWHISPLCEFGDEFIGVLHGEKRPNLLLAATPETRRQLQSLKDIAQMARARVKRRGAAMSLAKKGTAVAAVFGGMAAIPERVQL